MSDSAPAVPLATLPSGTVTFAFTDIVGSTQRWDSYPAAMPEVVRIHDALVRTAIERHGGHVFKTIGDAFCAAFTRPQDAVAAMLGAQRALAAADFRAVDGLLVRAAIHTGTADERAGDYFGPTVNRVARLLAIGHGGQVLVSRVAGDLMESELPAGVGLRDLGEHRLKDLARPERVYQVLAPELEAAFPPLRSLDALPNNLPRQLSSFIGRSREIAEITALLDKHRLVTIVGSGGIGKTRTSLQAAANLLDGSGDGVWFIELAPLAGGEYIPSTVAQAMGLTLAAGGDPAERLVDALRSKHALIVLDNCEHLIEAVARLVAAIVRRCPKIVFLASSRQGLGIAGEQTYRLPSLDVPPGLVDGNLKVRDVAPAGAIELFVARARAVDKSFRLTDESAGSVAEICRRLDGIPLAIELAAARVNILSVRQLRARLDNRFAVLTGGGRDLLPRHQTLRALIDWSYDLLDERERTLFRRLGIFVNGFTLEGAIAVGHADDLDRFDVFDALASLVDKSLVLTEPAGDAMRYRLLETTRAYAREKLAATGETDGQARRHLDHLRDRFSEADAAFERTGRRVELDALFTTELDEVRAALDFALRGTDEVAGADLLAATSVSWEVLGLYAEGLARSETFLERLPEENARLKARIWNMLSLIAENSGHAARGFAAAAQAVSYARSARDPQTLSLALLRYSSPAAMLGRFEVAEAALEEAEAIPGGSEMQRLRLVLPRFSPPPARRLRGGEAGLPAAP
jgi:predicted ATPase/class 3 adenylate cyclase